MPTLPTFIFNGGMSGEDLLRRFTMYSGHCLGWRGTGLIYKVPRISVKAQ